MCKGCVVSNCFSPGAHSHFCCSRSSAEIVLERWLVFVDDLGPIAASVQCISGPRSVREISAAGSPWERTHSLRMQKKRSFLPENALFHFDQSDYCASKEQGGFLEEGRFPVLKPRYPPCVHRRQMFKKGPPQKTPHSTTALTQSTGGYPPHFGVFHSCLG